ncbi:hypothetical protein [Sinorhizobium sp. 8-89]|uniref:hypothetical protein n=1 Tax=Sinorhizobium sp. 8-89 TaxID=3049089 RepID=UPI002867C1FE|nr:hypothetical protein [Sinorhizobium sp. 8-89]
MNVSDNGWTWNTGRDRRNSEFRAVSICSRIREARLPLVTASLPNKLNRAYARLFRVHLCVFRPFHGLEEMGGRRRRHHPHRPPPPPIITERFFRLRIIQSADVHEIRRPLDLELHQIKEIRPAADEAASGERRTAAAACRNV